MLDGSLSSSQTGLTITPKNKVATQIASMLSTKRTTTDKTPSSRDKNSVPPNEGIIISNATKQKLADVARGSEIVTPKGTVTMSTSVNKSATTNSSLLNKILKGKPTSKDKTQNIGQSAQKEGMDKTSFWEFIHAYRKLNASALNSVLSSSTRAPKTPGYSSSKKEESGKQTVDQSNTYY